MSLTTKPANVRELKRRILENDLIDENDAFSMRFWNIERAYVDQAHDCGTVMCMGGLAAALALVDNPATAAEETVLLNSGHRAAEWLGMDAEHAYQLFHPPHHPHITEDGVDATDTSIDPQSVFWETITPEEAAAALDLVLTTSNPDDIRKYWLELPR